MDQDLYPWSPIVSRPPLRWPDNARVALAVIVNLEHWDWEVPAGTPVAVSPMGGPEGLWTGNQPQFPDIGGWGNHEYGNRVGIFRILGLFDKHGITPTLALDRTVAEHYPTLVEEGRKRGAEFIAHGLSRRRLIHTGMTEDEERAYIRASIDAVEQATGKRPIGWSGPDFQETPNTPHLLAEEGIRYVCDWGNDEQPYRMTPRNGELYSLGVNAYLDDNYIHLHGRRTIDETSLLWREWFDGLYADGAATGRMMVLHLHPWIMGQPWRIRHLDEVLGHICARKGVWKATGAEIVEWFARVTPTPALTHRGEVSAPKTLPLVAAGQGGGVSAVGRLGPAPLPPGRFDYAPITDRPVIRWPGNARVAFWVAPNMEFFEYLPENRPTQPDIPHYSRMDYGNRVGFWRMLDVLNKHKVRACCCLNLELLDHFPEIKDAMVAADWDYMAHGLYNSRPIYDYTEDEERAYWQDFIAHVKEMTGKRLKGRLGGGAGYTPRTDDLMAEAGCLYHTSWIIDDQPWPITVRGGQKFIYVPYTGQTNDAGMLAWNREADYFKQMIKDQFDTLYREGEENGRVMCLSLHPHNIGRPNAAKHLDAALSYILGHDGVWNTTADDIAEYYMDNYYDQVTAWIAARKP
jgi:peptidoglycan/xylan/chitin deacetylase (PgdA/CDA1 family)